MTGKPPDPWNEEYDERGLARQHNIETGKFSELSLAYRENPSVENYLRLRRANPDKLIEVSTSWGLDWLISNEDTVRKFGIDPQDIASSLDADSSAISRVSLRILELLSERRAMTSSGKTHVQSRGEAIGDSLVNYLIAMMLDALDRYDNLHIPRDLIVLIKHQLGADVSAEARDQEVRQRRQTAIWGAAKLRQAGNPWTIREVARHMNVSPSTVLRWFEGKNFEDEVTKIFELLESDGFKDVSRLAEETRLKRKK